LKGIARYGPTKKRGEDQRICQGENGLLKKQASLGRATAKWQNPPRTSLLVRKEKGESLEKGAFTM